MLFHSAHNYSLASVWIQVGAPEHFEEDWLSNNVLTTAVMLVYHLVSCHAQIKRIDRSHYIITVWMGGLIQQSFISKSADGVQKTSEKTHWTEVGISKARIKQESLLELFGTKEIVVFLWGLFIIGQLLIRKHKWQINVNSVKYWLWNSYM